MTGPEQDAIEAALARTATGCTADAFAEALRIAWAIQKRGGTVDELVQLLDDRFRVAVDQCWDAPLPEEEETRQ